MLQIAEIIVAILGICGVLSITPICVTVLVCEMARIICEAVSKEIK